MRFKKSPQLPGAGRTRAWHHHGSHTPTSPGAVKWPVNPNKMTCQPKHFGRQCIGSTLCIFIAPAYDDAPKSQKKLKWS